jgi:hypothetical protein
MSEEKKGSGTDRKISRRSALKLTGAIAAAVAAGAVGGYEVNKPTLSGRQAVTLTETSVMRTTVTSAFPTALGTSAATVDLRPLINQAGLKVRNETDGAPCAVHALTFLIEYMYATRFISNLSQEYLQYVTFQVEKPPMNGEGKNFWALNIGYQKWGVVPYAYVPNQDTVPANIPNSILNTGRNGLRLNPVFIKDWAYTEATQDQLNQVVKFLDQNIPVAIGMLWPKNLKMSGVGGVNLMEVPTAVNKWDVVDDGHAVALVGYKRDPLFPGNGYFIFRNSWGEDWCDHGYGYMPFEYVLKYANDLFAYQMPAA